jgi:hypothetical protein
MLGNGIDVKKYKDGGRKSQQKKITIFSFFGNYFACSAVIYMDKRAIAASIMRRFAMTTTPQVQGLVQQKLEAFERLQPEFEACFQFVQDVHGQRRFSSFPIANTVRYLHARWICECKDRLLSIYRNIERYEGGHCLELLQHWQEGDTASVVEFLERKMYMRSLADLTRQIHEAQYQYKNEAMAKRLVHGRQVLLNREMNILQALEAIFALPEEELLKEVRAACEEYGHLPAQIAKQLEEMSTPIYSYVPHQALAQRNMMVMNALGVNVTSNPADLPGRRSSRVLEPTVPPGPYAQHVIRGYQELTAPLHNNIKADRFVDPPEYNGPEKV